jgi:hypothetical protein
MASLACIWPNSAGHYRCTRVVISTEPTVGAVDAPCVCHKGCAWCTVQSSSVAQQGALSTGSQNQAAASHRHVLARSLGAGNCAVQFAQRQPYNSGSRERHAPLDYLKTASTRGSFAAPAEHVFRNPPARSAGRACSPSKACRARLPPVGGRTCSCQGRLRGGRGSPALHVGGCTYAAGRLLQKRPQAHGGYSCQDVTAHRVQCTSATCRAVHKACNPCSSTGAQAGLHRTCRPSLRA